VAGGLAGSGGAALAGESEGARFTLYGKLYPQVSSYDYDGATRAGTTGGSNLVDPPAATADHLRRSTVDVSNSHVGFRASEKLGGSLTVLFQIEQRVRIDDGTGTWAGNRNSFLGLFGSLGTFKLGNVDTAYKEAGDPIGKLGISSGNFVSTSGVLSQGPVSDALDFHLRQPNVMQYESPRIGGLQFLGSWGKDEFKGNPGRGVNSLLNSYALTYEMGPGYVALGREIHHDFFGGSKSFAPVRNVAFDADGNLIAASVDDVRSRDSATRLSGMFKFRDTRVSLDLAQLEARETGNIATGNFKSYKNKRMSLVLEQKFGPWTGGFSFVTSDEGSCTLEGGGNCSTAGLDGRVVNLGARYSFSGRTQAFLIFSQLKNGQSASHDTTAINPSGGSAPEQGEDVRAVGIGVNHGF
jgi:predicted porin